MKNENFDQLAAELEGKLNPAAPAVTEDAPEETGDAGLLKAIMKAGKDFLSKGQSSDLKAEKDRRGSLTETSEDPAKNPKKSGGDYPDSSKYEARKGHDDDEDEEEDERPAFMKKKKKKVRKSVEEEDDSDDTDSDSDEAVDATEMVENLSKSMDEVKEGLTVFGEVLNELSESKSDRKFQELMVKSMTAIVERVDRMEKSMKESGDLAKSIRSLVGAPKGAGVQQSNVRKSVETGAEESTETEGQAAEVSKDDRQRLFKAVMMKQITQTQANNAIAKGDMSVLDGKK